VEDDKRPFHLVTMNTDELVEKWGCLWVQVIN